MFEEKDAATYRVVHDSLYRYSEEVTVLPHRLVVRPREGFDLRLDRFSLAISPSARVEWSRDVYGNSIARAHFDRPTAELRFLVDFTVRRKLDLAADPRSTEDPPAVSSNLYPLDYDELEHAVVSSYATPVYPEEAQRLSDWIRQCTAVGPGRSAGEIVLVLTRRIFESIRYQRRDERGTQTPEATLSLESGSCRDKATLLMEALRHLGFAARFASGYLDCAATRAAIGSTHAWTEVYFPDVGWRGFDPTTGRPVTHQHLLTGVSHHPRGVMPVGGSFIGPRGVKRELAVSVSVTADPSPDSATS